MKMWLLQGLIAAIPFYFAANTAGASEPDCGGEARIVVVKCDGAGGDVNCFQTDGGEGAKVVIKVVGDGTDGMEWIQGGDGDGQNVLVEMIGDPDSAAFATAVVEIDGDDGGDAPRRKIRVLKGKLTGESKGAFLGVTLTSSTSDDNGDGVRISGVIDDGPAAKAGLKAGDVVIAIDGDSVASGIGALTKALGARESGDDVDVVVLRDGDEATFSVTLGSRGQIASSFAFGPGGIGVIEDRVKARGRMVLKNKDGDWEVKDLGDLEAIKDLPLNIKMFMPEIGSRSISISTDGGEKTVSINRSTDGETLAIERHGDGEIKVTRIDADGEETLDTYASENQLQKADEEAYDLLQDSTGNAAVFAFQGIGDEDGTFDFHFNIDTDNLHENIMQWRGELDGTLGEAREAYERAMEELGDLKEGLYDQHRAKFDRLHALFLQDSDGKNLKFPGIARYEALGKPKHAFEVRSDGTIEVKIRKGDAQLVQIFDDAEDLQDRNPELYSKYRELMDEHE